MIPVTSFAGKTVAVFGLGGSGLASCHALKAGGAEVVASDDSADNIANAAQAGFVTADLRKVSWANFAALVDAVRTRRVLPLGAIRNQRSLLGVTNLCAALDAARTHPLAANETFLVSDGKDVSTPELVRAIGDALEVRPHLWRWPLQLLLLLATLALRRDAARRLLESFAIDSAKIRRTLGWTPPLTLADELQRLAQALRRTPS